MNNLDKKAILQDYKNRTLLGGIYGIRNTQNGKIWLESTTDMAGSIHRFDFSLATGSCISPKLQGDWKSQGADAFEFLVLEEWTQKDTQTDKEFKEDLKALKELWKEKYPAHQMY